MRFDKRGSLEIGVNTIVILVIAMILLGLGIGFVKGLFGTMSKLPDQIPLDQIGATPTASDPVVLAQKSITVKSGEPITVNAGIYNKWDDGKPYSLTIPTCTDGIIPLVKSTSQTIVKGEAKGYQIIIYGKTSSAKIPEGTYICTLGAVLEGSNTPVGSMQFTLTVTG